MLHHLHHPIHRRELAVPYEKRFICEHRLRIGRLFRYPFNGTNNGACGYPGLPSPGSSQRGHKKHRRADLPDYLGAVLFFPPLTWANGRFSNQWRGDYRANDLLVWAVSIQGEACEEYPGNNLAV